MNKLLTLTMVFALLIVGMVSATAIGTTYVTGTVTDGSNAPVANAAVSVTCMSESANTTTDLGGNYLLLVNNPTCVSGSTAYVTATKDGVGAGSNSGVVCTAGVEGDCDINVAFVDVQIPEFGVIGGALVLLAGIGIIAYKRK